MTAFAPRSTPGQHPDQPRTAPRRQILAYVWVKGLGSWDAVFDHDRTIALYLDHIARVGRDCDAARLVEWNVADGWSP